MDENPPKLKNVRKIISAVAGIVITIMAVFIYVNLFGAPQKNAKPEQLVIALKANNTEIKEKLKAEGFIKNTWAFQFALSWKGISEIKPGGYKISKSMDVWGIIKILSQEPYMKWIVIPEGLRKEEIADILASALEWNDQIKKDWVTKYTAIKYDYTEGVYFPDTYLIPADESPLDVAERLQAKFQEKFSPYAKEAVKQNIKWNTLLKIASIIQREAAGKNDMPLIAGILWNRLLGGMKLDIDATIQYARGKTDNGWWAPVKPADKQIDSPYNTYLYKGLPPLPIDNPGLDAIEAVLYPVKTKCLYYLHDESKTIHCAETYKEHQQNIEKYLK